MLQRKTTRVAHHLQSVCFLNNNHLICKNSQMQLNNSLKVIKTGFALNHNIVLVKDFFFPLNISFRKKSRGIYCKMLNTVSLLTEPDLKNPK